MVKKNDSIANKPIVNFYDIELSSKQQKRILEQLESLSSSFPPNSKVSLRFEKRQSSYVGTINIDSPLISFHARKASHNLMQTYLLIEESIREQIRDWKRVCFSAELEKTLTSAGALVH